MSIATHPPVFAWGHELDTDPSAFGFLRESRDAADDFGELRARLENDGYLYLPGYLDRDEVLGVRRTVPDRLAEKRWYATCRTVRRWPTGRI